MKICQLCGNMEEDDSSFCVLCGEPFDDEKSEAITIEAETEAISVEDIIAQDISETDDEEWLCSTCGSINTGGECCSACDSERPMLKLAIKEVAITKRQNDNNAEEKAFCDYFEKNIKKK